MADTVRSYVTSWKCVLLASALYGSEILPWTDQQIQELEKEQNKFAKTAMSIPYSSANSCVQVLLGLKKIKHLILESRVRMVNKLRNAQEGSILQEIWSHTKDNASNLLWSRLEQLIREEGIPIKVQDITIKDVNKHFERKTRMEVLSMKSMLWITIPLVMWKTKKFIIDSDWARTYTQFLTQNAGLGNRTNKLKNYGVSDKDGRVTDCPLCGRGSNDEKHIVIKCKQLTNVRQEHQLIEEISMNRWLEERRDKDDHDIMRDFFGGLRKDITYYMDRGIFLMNLRREFFAKWSEICGEQIECSLD
jgi:hypothetical protein